MSACEPFEKQPTNDGSPNVSSVTWTEPVLPDNVGGPDAERLTSCAASPAAATWRAVEPTASW